MEYNIKVCCRVRPRSDKETGLAPMRFIEDNSLLINNEQYTFDKVLNPSATQEDAYNNCVGETTLDDILSGFNYTIFAYGQSSSGKTHSIMGYNGGDGILPQTIKKLFQKIENDERDIQYSISVSMYEIYMERIRDLLNINEDNLKIREGGFKKGIWIQGVVEQPVNSYEDCMGYIEVGNSNRAVGETRLNNKSSRSHALYSFTITKTMLNNGKKTESRLVLVDLAGSEKVSKTGATGQTLMEAQYTNKSLTTLGIVIKSLSEKNSHIPYRDSKLTRLLTDSLGGNSKTCLLITCSPAEVNLSETISTLKFGSRTKLIKNKPCMNVELSIEEYKRIVEGLKGKRGGDGGDGGNNKLQDEIDRLTSENKRIGGEAEQLRGEAEQLRGEVDVFRAEVERLNQKIELINSNREVKILINTDSIAHKLLENKEECIRVLTTALEGANTKLINQRTQYENMIYLLKRNGKSLNLPIKSPRRGG